MPERPEGDAQTPSQSELRAFALGLLSRREYGRHELTLRLIRKWGDGPAVRQLIDGCVTHLTDGGLLSDRRFAESFVSARRRRGQGPLKIRAELKHRRVESGAIDECVDESDENWTLEALRWLRRHAPEHVDRKLRAQYYRRLTRRGFSHGQAMAALDRLASRIATDSLDD